MEEVHKAVMTGLWGSFRARPPATRTAPNNQHRDPRTLLRHAPLYTYRSINPQPKVRKICIDA
jgi:hypothetical protein